MILEYPHCKWYTNPEHEKRNIEKTLNFLKEAQKHVAIVVFLYPGCQKNIEEYRKYLKGPNTVIFELKAKGLPPDYWDIHPRPEITKWYGKKIAKWLGTNQMILCPVDL